MKINESNFVEELSHRNEKALEYVDGSVLADL